MLRCPSHAHGTSSSAGRLICWPCVQSPFVGGWIMCPATSCGATGARIFGAGIRIYCTRTSRCYLSFFSQRHYISIEALFQHQAYCVFFRRLKPKLPLIDFRGKHAAARLEYRAAVWFVSLRRLWRMAVFCVVVRSCGSASCSDAGQQHDVFFFF